MNFYIISQKVVPITIVYSIWSTLYAQINRLENSGTNYHRRIYTDTYTNICHLVKNQTELNPS